MKKFQELLEDLRRRRKAGIVLILICLACFGEMWWVGIRAMVVSTKTGVETPAVQIGAVFATGLVAVVFLVWFLVNCAKLGKLREQLSALPFYRIRNDYYTSDKPFGGVLEQLDLSLADARIAVNEHYKSILLPKETTVELSDFTSNDSNSLLKIELARAESSLQAAFDFMGNSSVRGRLYAQISKALGPLLPLIGRLDNGFLDDAKAEILTNELCRQLSELGPDVLGPYDITGFHQADRCVLPDDQLKLWEKLSTAAAKPTFCQHQTGSLGNRDSCWRQYQANDDEDGWRPTVCSFVNEEANCPNYLAPSPTI